MTKVEVLHNREGFRVQVTFREPMEYFFEIATHILIFENVIDANRLRRRVEQEIKALGWKSPSFALGEQYWNYSSSAYDVRMKRANVQVKFPTSNYAKQIIEGAD